MTRTGRKARKRDRKEANKYQSGRQCHARKSTINLQGFHRTNYDELIELERVHGDHICGYIREFYYNSKTDELAGRCSLSADKIKDYKLCRQKFGYNTGVCPLYANWLEKRQEEMRKDPVLRKQLEAIAKIEDGL